MISELILKSDLLDILFDKRNKSYGAYVLRKFYPNRIKTSLLIMLSLVIMLAAFTFLPDKKISAETYVVEEVTLKYQVIDKTEEAAKPTPKNAAAAVPSQVKPTSTIAIVPEKDSVEKFRDVSQLATGSKEIIGEPGFGDPGPGDKKQGEVLPKESVPAVALIAGPTDNPDIQASFPGGDKELIKFLQRNLRSPEDMEQGEMVEVTIKYVVGFDGNLQSFMVVKDGGELFNNEVIRVLKKMPKWNPGKKGGQNVPVYYTIPVKFTTSE